MNPPLPTQPDPSPLSESARLERRAQLLARLDGMGSPLVLDGATGTELERAGIRTGLPLWSTHALLEAPETVERIHRTYLEAGAELITANTFRTQRRTLARAGLGARDAELTTRAVGLARTARQVASRPSLGSTWIAGSLPPLEDCYRPDRVPDAKDLEAEHGRQAELLALAGVDLVLVETMNSRREAAAAARAAARTGLPFAVSFVSWTPGRILSGEALAEAALEVLDLGARATGVNCVPAASLPASRRALSPLAAPLLVSPNLGQPDEEGGFVRGEIDGPATWMTGLEDWFDGSTRVIGGCCGTGPEHIRSLVARLRTRRDPVARC